MISEEKASVARQLLKRFYGYNSFRPGQLEIIDAVTSGRDAVVLMPTGGGKSICYQLPALMMEGCTVVISPLIALMEDQTAALVANGIPAVALHSNRDDASNREALEAAAQGKIKLIYVSPERLLADIDTWPRNVRINLFAVDEAHCISQWGHDFRPDYTALSAIKENFPHIPMMALTATADRLTRDDITTQLRLSNPLRWTGSFNRPNLSLRVEQGASAKQRVAHIQNLIRKYPNDAGIVYTLSRQGAEDMTDALKRAGYRVACYHAGMSPRARAEAQKAFTNGDVQVVCATVAFGMGIDKSNIRWVVHNNLPGNIESYYQEIGRAGRDGLPSETILFYSMQDVMLRRKFIEESGNPLVASEKLNQMLKYAEATVCRRRILLSYFSEETNCDCGNCDVCINPPSRFDGTILAQKAGSAIVRTNQQVGFMTLIDILRGSARADIRQKGYDRIKTYGAGRDMTQQQWQVYIGQMIQLGLFEIAFEENNHLKLTSYGEKVLYGKERIDLSYFTPQTFATKRKTTREELDNRTPDEHLFEHLKSVRMVVAKMHKLAPYMVFSDASLKDMSIRKPRTIKEFSEVFGVGERKCADYGPMFVHAIKNYLNK